MPTLHDSFDLFKALHHLDLLHDCPHPLWWPNALSFEVVIGTILTQNTKWTNVQKALDNLTAKNALTLQAIADMPLPHLQQLIKPSGFYNTKGKNLHRLCSNILDTYGNFETFSDEVTREWLLEQKGIGLESADALLCYACGREEMVADAYSYRLLLACGLEMPDYEDIKSFLEEGIQAHFETALALYDTPKTLHELYCLFHGYIVAYCNTHSIKKQVQIDALGL